MPMLYFAYGSNMSQRRFFSRIPSATLHGWGVLREHQLRFHKSGRDGSAKADALYTGHYHDLTYGVLYNLSEEERRVLDIVEDCGVGYEAKAVEVVGECGNRLSAFTYVALHIDRSMRPYHWYWQHVLQGAEDAGFPEEYILEIRQFRFDVDNDANRVNKELGIYQGV